MKNIHVLAVALGLTIGCIYASPASAQTKNREPVATFVVPANKGYVEPFSEHSRGISVPVGYPETKGVVSRWKDGTKSVVWYLYQKKGDYEMLLDETVLQGKTLNFTLGITSTETFKEFTPIITPINLKGTGKQDTVPAAHVIIPRTGYYRYELKPKNDPASAITIRSLLFKSNEAGAEVHNTDYQSSPSVHLSFSSTAPTTKSYNWIYEEILVPEGADPLATYYMSLGFYRGYMGIQTNSSKERRVLFSVWDSKDAQKDSTIKQNDYVSLVAKGKTTTVNSFGGEGTGGQSYVPTANWKTGKPVKFLMNLLPQDNNSIVISAWYQVEGEDWTYVASWRAPKEQKYFDGFYSFIENYGYTNGQIRREAYYYNAWGRENTTDKWINFNKVHFSHTDGKEGQRVDYEQGVSAKFPNRFYMASGGYTATLKTADEMPLSTKPPLDNLKPFEQQVKWALSQEKKPQK